MSTVEHGTRACYLRGCRRDECVEAKRRYMKAYRHAAKVHIRSGRVDRPLRTDTGPIADHIDRLLASGWTVTAVATESGVGRTHVSNLRHRYFARVRRDFAAAILALEPLTPDPDYVDDVLVERFARGRCDWRELTRVERIAAAVLLDRWGVPRAEIERRTHVRPAFLYAAWREAAS